MEWIATVVQALLRNDDEFFIWSSLRAQEREAIHKSIIINKETKL